MQSARLLFALASRERTGTLTIRNDASPSSILRIELERGYVYSLQGAPRSSRPDDMLREILRLAADARGEFVDGEKPLRLGRVTPFHPAVLVRNHVEGRLPQDAGVEVRARARDEALRLLFPPHASCLGRDERPIVAMLAAAPRSFAALDATGVTPPSRIERLVAFLDAVHSLAVERTPWELLGLVEGASHEDVRKAYKRLARELHPDLHPDEDARELAQRFAVVSDAYRRLLPGG